MNKEKLLIDLIKINSESGKEKEIGDFICRRLSSKFKIIKQKINNNFNIFASVGTPRIILVSHLDTVSGQLDIKQNNDYIYGRGACDNKSQIAASILAAEKALEKGIKDFGLLFTVEEETTLNGVKKALDLIPKSVKLIIVGEPTNLEIVKGQKGLIYLKLICRGKSAHGSMPEKGINAIELLMNELINIKKIKFNEDSVLGKNVINIGKIKGGDYPNVVPDYAEAVIVIRNTIKAEEVINKIKKELNCEIKVETSYDPVLNDDAEKIALKLDLKTRVVPYFTEAYFLNKKAKTIILGAGLEEDAHSINEKVKITDFEKLIKVYLKILEIQDL